MKLIKMLQSRINKNSKRKYKEPWALFECWVCGQRIDRSYHNGIRQDTCGCISFRDAAVTANLKHGEFCNSNSESSLYTTWRSMKKRCYYEKDDSFKWYGKRGIGVCKEWINNYLRFKIWALNNGFVHGLKLDRKDNNGNYCPKNCRFITHLENSRKQTNVILNIESVREIRAVYEKGKRPTQNELGLLYGVSSTNICNIINNKIWIE